MDTQSQNAIATDRTSGSPQEMGESDLERRELLKRLGKLAIYTTPAVMAVLMNGQNCLAGS